MHHIYFTLLFLENITTFNFVNIIFHINDDEKQDYVLELNKSVKTKDIPLMQLDEKLKSIIIDSFLLNLDKRCIINFNEYICYPSSLKNNNDISDNELIQIYFDNSRKYIHIPNSFYSNDDERLITYVLYNNLPIYSVGAIENLKYIDLINDNTNDNTNNNSKNYKGLIYIRSDVNQDTIGKLAPYKHSKIVNVPDIPDCLMMMLRYLPLEQCKIFSSRDTDCRVSQREEVAFDEWIKSNKSLHVMRDHPHHNF